MPNADSPYIETPLLSYNFQILFPIDEEHRVKKLITKCEFDYVNNTMTILVIQPRIDNGFTKLLNTIRNTSITVLYLQSNSTEFASQLTYPDCKKIAHTLELNYGNSDVAYHKMVFEFDPLTISGYPLVCVSENEE